MKLIKITWLDHTTYDDCAWRSIEESKELRPITMTTVGYLLEDHKDYYIVASTISNVDTCTNEFLILKGTIKKFKEIEQ